MTETHLYGTDRSEVTVWDTDRNIVWGPRPTDEDAAPTYPPTDDPMIERLRPPVDKIRDVLIVDPTTPGRYETITAAFQVAAAIQSSPQVGGASPESWVLVLVAPGEYREHLRPPDWTALVSLTGDPDDVRVWEHFTVGPVWSPVINPTGACYVEGIHFDSDADYIGDPGAGNAPATMWQVNAAPGATVTLVNIRSTSRNEWLNTGAFQSGDLSTVTAYRSVFAMEKGSQPANMQTAQNWRSMNPDHRSDYIFIDCEASCPEGLVVGLADLRSGAHDRLIWTGGTIHQAPGNTAQFFHAAFLDQYTGPHNCETYCTPEVTYAGDGEIHTWGEPADLAGSIPEGGVGPGSRAYYYPQALSETAPIPTGAADTTLTLVPGRHYFVPVPLAEARTLAGYALDVTSGTASITVQLWGGPTRGGQFFRPGRAVDPQAWKYSTTTVTGAPGTVAFPRGSASNIRLYPGEQQWIRITADAACTVAASSTLAAGGLVYTQDPDDPDPILQTAGAVPVPVLRTGIV